RIVGRDSQDLGYVRPASMDIRHHNEIGTLRTESSSCDPPSSTATERPYVTMPPHLDLMVGFPLGDLLELRRGDVITDRFAKIWVTRVRPVLLPLAGEISLGVPVANKRIPLGLWETVTEQWILSQSIRDTTRQMRCILRYFGQDLGLECVSILLRLPPMC